MRKASSYKLDEGEFHFLLQDLYSKGLLMDSVGTTGGLAGTVCDPKVVFAAAIKSAATSIVLSHNHPSGALTPSQARYQFNEKVKDSWRVLRYSSC